ncbi:hypothetical protein CLOP_g21113 [Closterium sp. NIES-67]|nr:hypothetical protein CLOP_g21113 [Closterium sp. NIES-67]
MAPKRERVSRSGEPARRVTRSSSLQEEGEHEDARDAREVEEVEEIEEVGGEVGRRTRRSGEADGAETNGSDGSRTRQSKRLRMGGASGGGIPASQPPVDVVKRERAAGAVKREVDVARRQAEVVKREADVVKREKIARAARLNKGKEKVVESDGGYDARDYHAEAGGYARDSQAAGPSTQPRARGRAEPGEDAEVPVTPSGMGEGRDGPGGTPTQTMPTRREATTAIVLTTPRAMPRGVDGFQPGNILMVQVRHFMTYASISARPSPRLNLIVGPNGSGKSSLVCAIGLGLGGEPKMLGRAAHVGEFVQRGECSAEININLRGDAAGEEVQVTRRISSENRTEWFLNGRGARREQVLECMKHFNIQISNLTQFLPQDRVCAFAGMSPIQLLEETQRAVGDPQLSQQHTFLKDQQDVVVNLDATLKSHEEQLSKLQKENAEVEQDVEKVQRREAILKEVALMKKKAPWLKYERVKARVREMEGEVQARHRERDALQTQVMAAKDPLVVLKESRAGFSSLVAKIGKENEARERKLRDLSEESDHLVQQAVERERDIVETRRKAVTREQRLAKAQQELQQLQAQLTGLPEVKPPKAEVDPLSKRGRELRMQAGEKEREARQVEQQLSALREQLQRVEKRIHDVTNSRHRRIQRAGDRELMQACEWLDHNRAQCKGAVYGPILAEVNVIDPAAHAAFLEQHVAGWVWKAFVTTVSEDRDLLVRHLKPLGMAVVNESSRPEELGPPAHAMAVDAHLQRLGVTHRLDEVFNAAPVVRSVLNQQSQLFRSFIGSRDADRHAEDIQGRGVEDLWTPDSHYRWQRSRYNGSVSASMHGVRASRFFAEDSGLQEEEQLHAEKERVEARGREVQERMQAVKREQRALENEASQCERQREEIVNRYMGQKKQREDVQSRILQKRELVASLGRSEDMEEMERRARADIANIMDRQLANAKKTHKHLLGLWQEKRRLSSLQLAVDELTFLVRERESEFKDLDEQLLRLQQEVMREEDRLQASKQEVGAALATARAAVDLRRDEEAKRLFETLPDSLEELHEEVEERTGQANRIVCPNPHVLQQFQERQEQIRSMQGKVESESQRLEELKAEVERVQGQWLPRLRSLVVRINEAFSRNFQEMAVAGEVALDEKGADFRSYGIRIRVKFRESAELQDLSAHHQSGGERSVSTILYLVSLQDLTRCPFRVVDEINQGMDPTNERNMFQQLVRAATHDHTPQCFLLTPKLLPDLDYGESCTVHCVMNGLHAAPLAATNGFKEGGPLWDSLQESAAAT